jgi:hypothetical protein
VGRQSEDKIAAGALRYVVECQPIHERLRQLLTQLGGLSLMTMLERDGAPAFDRNTPLRLAGDALGETRETLRDLAVPERALHHHHHLSEAIRALGRVSGLLSAPPSTRKTEAARQELSTSLRLAADHLRFAGRAMPGFEMVDLGQSCCAAHAAALPSTETTAELRF